MSFTRTPPRGVTVVEAAALATVISAMACISWLYLSSGNHAERQAETQQAAQVILGAAGSWQSENHTGCPTLSQLKYEGYLERSAVEDDAWGHRFRISCHAGETSVLSPGQDGTLRTEDDITVHPTS